MNAVFDKVEQRILNMDYLKTKYSFNGIFEMYGLADQLWLVKECSMIEGTSYYILNHSHKYSFDNLSALFAIATKNYRESKLLYIISQLHKNDITHSVSNIIGRMSFVLPENFIVVGPDDNNPPYYIWNQKIYNSKTAEQAFLGVLKLFI